MKYTFGTRIYSLQKTDSTDLMWLIHVVIIYLLLIVHRNDERWLHVRSGLPGLGGLWSSGGKVTKAAPAREPPASCLCRFSINSTFPWLNLCKEIKRQNSTKMCSLSTEAEHLNGNQALFAKCRKRNWVLVADLNLVLNLSFTILSMKYLFTTVDCSERFWSNSSSGIKINLIRGIQCDPQYIRVRVQHYIKYTFSGTFTDGDTWFAKKSETLTKSPHKLHNDVVLSSASELNAISHIYNVQCM